ncbi:hypothetical protein EYF80_021283 [Liparis tanakae]|uniref:Uncharacterized protein n=1 Tax=Liparis tanakae TaxID=230148 RepID=A0A4Z2HRX1_9TELE|nr:hypothetical protein EYF80_021283 [Liparis tanakae]
MGTVERVLGAERFPLARLQTDLNVGLQSPQAAQRCGPKTSEGSIEAHVEISFKQHQVCPLQGRVQIRPRLYGNTTGRCQDVGSLGVGVQLRPPPVFIHRRPPIPPPGPSLAGSVFLNRERIM